MIIVIIEFKTYKTVEGCQSLKGWQPSMQIFRLEQRMNKILLFNPRSAIAKHRIPNSIMNIAASVDGIYHWTIVDGNREEHPYEKI